MKKILSLIFSCILIFSVLPISLLAVEQLTVVAETVTTEIGSETVEVDITIANNPGIASTGFAILYDAKAFSYHSYETTGEIFGSDSSDLTVNGETDGMVVISTYSATNRTADGVLCTLKFTPKDGISVGTYSLTLDIDSDPIFYGTFNETYEQVDTAVTNGSITVTEKIILEFQDTITFPAVSHVYDGTEKSIAVSGDLPEGTTVTYTNAKATNAGTYNATAVLKCEGYNDKTLTAEFTIQPAPITLTLSNQSKVVGQADPALTYTVTKGNLYSSDKVTGTPVREVGETAGTYKISKGSLAINDNYAITFVDGVFTISAIPVTGITVSPTEITMKDTETVILNALLSPETATDKTVTWTTDKTGLVTLGTAKFNEVTGQPYVEITGANAGAGAVTVTAAANGFTASCKVTVVCDHALTHHTAVAAGCETAGMKEHWICDKCGKYFADAEGETEITEADTVIPATGHKMGEWNVTKQPTADADGIAEKICVNGCGLKETKTVARVQIPVSDESDGDSKQVSVNVIEGDSAEDVHVSINQEELDAKLEELGVTGDGTGETASGVITIDVAAAADTVDTIDAINQVTIPKKSVDNVAEAANDSKNNTTSLEVKLSSGTIQFDAAALDRISVAAGDQNAEGVKMVVNTVEAEAENTADKAAEITDKLEMNEAETAALKDVADNVSDNNGEILSAVEIAVVPVVNNEAKKEEEIHNLGGEVTVTINVDLDGYDIYGVTIHHISPSGEVEEITAKSFVYDSKAKTLTFTVDSFSAFVLTYVKPEAYILGDVNGDGVVNTSDARYVLRYVVKYVDAGINIWYGDVNRDGVINTSDARYILRYVVRYDDNLGIGQLIEN